MADPVPPDVHPRCTARPGPRRRAVDEDPDGGSRHPAGRTARRPGAFRAFSPLRRPREAGLLERVGKPRRGRIPRDVSSSEDGRRAVTDVLDLRGLPPPEPLVRALEAVEALPDGDELVVLTERRPVHLLPLLLERGVEVRRCASSRTVMKSASAASPSGPGPAFLSEAPTPSLPMAFFLPAVALLLAAAFAAPFLAAKMADWTYQQEILALVHTVTLGFLLAVFLGASVQLLPVVAGVTVTRTAPRARGGRLLFRGHAGDGLSLREAALERTRPVCRLP